MVDIQFFGFGGTFGGLGVPLTCHINLEDNSITIGRGAVYI